MTDKNYYWIKFMNGTVEKTWDKLSSEEIKVYGCGVECYQVVTKDNVLGILDGSKWITKKKPVIDLERSIKELKDFIEELRSESNKQSGEVAILQKQLKELKADSITSESFVSIHYPLSDPDKELERTLRATDLALALWDLKQLYRDRRKYHDQEPAIVTEDEFFGVLEKHGIDLDRILV
jgi:hypothetical protein